MRTSSVIPVACLYSQGPLLVPVGILSFSQEVGGVTGLLTRPVTISTTSEEEADGPDESSKFLEKRRLQKKLSRSLPTLPPIQIFPQGKDESIKLEVETNGLDSSRSGSPVLLGHHLSSPAAGQGAGKVGDPAPGFTTPTGPSAKSKSLLSPAPGHQPASAKSSPSPGGKGSRFQLSEGDVEGIMRGVKSPEIRDAYADALGEGEGKDDPPPSVSPAKWDRKTMQDLGTVKFGKDLQKSLDGEAIQNGLTDTHWAKIVDEDLSRDFFDTVEEAIYGEWFKENFGTEGPTMQQTFFLKYLPLHYPMAQIFKDNFVPQFIAFFGPPAWEALKRAKRQDVKAFEYGMTPNANSLLGAPAHTEPPHASNIYMTINAQRAALDFYKSVYTTVNTGYEEHLSGTEGAASRYVQFVRCGSYPDYKTPVWTKDSDGNQPWNRQVIESKSADLVHQQDLMDGLVAVVAARLKVSFAYFIENYGRADLRVTGKNRVGYNMMSHKWRAAEESNILLQEQLQQDAQNWKYDNTFVCLYCNDQSGMFFDLMDRCGLQPAALQLEYKSQPADLFWMFDTLSHLATNYYVAGYYDFQTPLYQQQDHGKNVLKMESVFVNALSSTWVVGELRAGIGALRGKGEERGTKFQHVPSVVYGFANAAGTGGKTAVIYWELHRAPLKEHLNSDPRQRLFFAEAQPLVLTRDQARAQWENTFFDLTKWAMEYEPELAARTEKNPTGGSKSVVNSVYVDHLRYGLLKDFVQSIDTEWTKQELKHNHNRGNKEVEVQLMKDWEDIAEGKRTGKTKLDEKNALSKARNRSKTPTSSSSSSSGAGVQGSRNRSASRGGSAARSSSRPAARSRRSVKFQC
ncbi:unnamed protein product [Amoebophrya sp. A120]|nr:unnamed protein product [Amoebophrya sp. A120]|eukprot:GSA120T00001171001.1